MTIKQKKAILNLCDFLGIDNPCLKMTNQEASQTIKELLKEVPARESDLLSAQGEIY